MSFLFQHFEVTGPEFNHTAGKYLSLSAFFSYLS